MLLSKRGREASKACTKLYERPGSYPNGLETKTEPTRTLKRLRDVTSAVQRRWWGKGTKVHTGNGVRCDHLICGGAFVGTGTQSHDCARSWALRFSKIMRSSLKA